MTDSYHNVRLCTKSSKNEQTKTQMKTKRKERYDSELPYERPDLIEVMEIEIDLTIYQFL